MFMLTPDNLRAQQEHNARELNEPAQVRLVNPEMIQFALDKTFTKTEFERLKKNKLYLKCYVDSSGYVQTIDTTLNVSNFISQLNLEILKLNLQKYVQLEIPADYKKEELASSRYFIIAWSKKK